MSYVFAKSEEPDQMPRSAASDLGLHCLPDTLLGVSRLQWVNNLVHSVNDTLPLNLAVLSKPDLLPRNR